ncbi:hypothetical protein COY90_02015 [Candidatus Roizmanbacteria bacterium CG_4_10_14_0_8_um_filter_39_9]|uniref:Big-1 domain-containing protein n=1 Tax=Candidatus Roizmanbacteria bacterium CG_4_10_14_0_8_um_filter_39_9 TaxID=1974829 RepID=A0A2M7QE99_9BACT|nr:MAG: hypothetical protein COY90_02015 [Candidatus Roizmanbacteria bacterium CG_4_10_14_0_8_um_filter_39_9]
MSMQKMIILFLIFIIVFMFFTGLFFFYEARFMSGRASVVTTGFSPENSTVVPVLRRASIASGQKVRVMVYVLSEQGTGAFGRKVEISNPDPLNITVDQAQQQTAQDGIVYFDISSKIAGVFDLEVKVDGYTLPSKAHIEFN